MKKVVYYNSSIVRNEMLAGETLETKVERISVNKEAIKDGAPIIHVSNKKGVEPSYNIRSDRFDIAIDALNAVSGKKALLREQRNNIVDVVEQSENT